MRVRSEKELKALGREKDGPLQLEPRDDDPPLEPGKDYQVFLMARGRCKCIIKVKNCSEMNITVKMKVKHTVATHSLIHDQL